MMVMMLQQLVHLLLMMLVLHVGHLIQNRHIFLWHIG
jgi:hypothetical protein